MHTKSKEKMQTEVTDADSLQVDEIKNAFGWVENVSTRVKWKSRETSSKGGSRGAASLILRMSTMLTLYIQKPNTSTSRLWPKTKKHWILTKYEKQFSVFASIKKSKQDVPIRQKQKQKKKQSKQKYKTRFTATRHSESHPSVHPSYYKEALSLR